MLCFYVLTINPTLITCCVWSEKSGLVSSFAKNFSQTVTFIILIFCWKRTNSAAEIMFKTSVCLGKSQSYSHFICHLSNSQLSAGMDKFANLNNLFVWLKILKSASNS